MKRPLTSPGNSEGEAAGVSDAGEESSAKKRSGEEPELAFQLGHPLKFLSWNVMGIGPRLRKGIGWQGFREVVEREKPDVIAMQEVGHTHSLSISLSHSHTVSLRVNRCI